jgi:hypothetical protein
MVCGVRTLQTKSYFFILFSKASDGFAKGENLGLVPIWDKSFSFDLLLRFHAQKSPWWPRLAGQQSQLFKRGAAMARSGGYAWRARPRVKLPAKPGYGPMLASG